ncbi:uncharacterized protein VTP21DRAFT_9466 [Calcarisporiella thermophila]|uniref:uncharacterized protein n=1 Tax=Calcarisporiella thermophila TaxID=911321 RepID=UPI003743D550
MGNNLSQAKTNLEATSTSSGRPNPRRKIPSNDLLKKLRSASLRILTINANPPDSASFKPSSMLHLSLTASPLSPSPEPPSKIEADTEAGMAEPRWMENEAQIGENSEKYEWMYERKFRKISGSKYLFPHDDSECRRLTVQHYMMRWRLQRNFSAPVEPLLRKGCRVLDVGCGPAVWLIEMAQDYPASRFTGLDMVTSFFPANPPTNCEFVQGNILSRLPFEDGSFDYVYMRFFVAALTIAQWPHALQELLRVTNSEGWIEVVDANGGIISDMEEGAILQLRELFIHTLSARGMDYFAGEHLRDRMALLNLDHFESHSYLIPVGSWGGRLGALSKMNILDAIRAVVPVLDLASGKLRRLDEVRDTLEKVERELEIHRSYIETFVAFGQKRQETLHGDQR